MIIVIQFKLFYKLYIKRIKIKPKDQTNKKIKLKNHNTNFILTLFKINKCCL